jgi:hypothetical protein
MRKMTIGMLAVGAVAASGCGSTKTYANSASPASPVNLTVYINNSRVSVSPSTVGAGPVVFIVTNQASNAESLTIQSAGSGAALAHTGPINPQGTAQVSVNFSSPGTYTVATSTGPTTDASLAGGVPASIRPATVQVGSKRSSSSSNLLQP